MSAALERMIPWSIVATVGAFLILGPLVTIAPNLWPVNLGTPQWRFGGFGFVLGATLFPTLGVALLLWAGVLKESPGMVRRTALFAGVAAGVLAVLLVIFVLDSLGMVRASSEAAPPVFWAAMVRAALVGGLSIPVLIVLAMAGWRTAGRLPSAPVRPSELVVGS
ncbi:MAG: hypothetical protein ABR551_08205 [Gemmatimonadales bacterium]